MKEYIIKADIEGIRQYETIAFGKVTGELIRCKDCKYNPKWSGVGCPMAGCMSRTDEWYCPKAERKESANEVD